MGKVRCWDHKNIGVLKNCIWIDSKERDRTKIAIVWGWCILMKCPSIIWGTTISTDLDHISNVGERKEASGLGLGQDSHARLRPCFGAIQPQRV